MTSTPPSCWICLDNEPDEKGKPIIRDCACRGTDQGYAHISCIVDYAKSQNSSQELKFDSKELADYVYEIQRPWKVCNCCKQCYCNDVAMELATTGLLTLSTSSNSNTGNNDIASGASGISSSNTTTSTAAASNNNNNSSNGNTSTAAAAPPSCGNNIINNNNCNNNNNNNNIAPSCGGAASASSSCGGGGGGGRGRGRRRPGGRPAAGAVPAVPFSSSPLLAAADVDPIKSMFKRIAALQLMGSTVAVVTNNYSKAIQYYKLVTDYLIKKNQPNIEAVKNNTLVQMMIKHQSLLAFKDMSECYANDHHYKDAMVARKRCIKLSEEVMVGRSSSEEGKLQIQQHKIKVEFYSDMVKLANNVKPEYRHMINHMYENSTQALEVKSKEAKANYELLLKKYDNDSGDGSIKEQHNRLDILNAKAYYGSTLCTLSSSSAEGQGRSNSNNPDNNEEGFRLMEEATKQARLIYGINHPSSAHIEFQYQKALKLFGNNSNNNFVPAAHDVYQPKMIATIIGIKNNNNNGSSMIENGKQVEVIKQRKDGKYQVRLLGEGNGQVYKASPDNLKF